MHMYINVRGCYFNPQPRCFSMYLEQVDPDSAEALPSRCLWVHFISNSCLHFINKMIIFGPGVR